MALYRPIRGVSRRHRVKGVRRPLYSERRSDVTAHYGLSANAGPNSAIFEGGMHAVPLSS